MAARMCSCKIKVAYVHLTHNLDSHWEPEGRLQDIEIQKTVLSTRV